MNNKRTQRYLVYSERSGARYLVDSLKGWRFGERLLLKRGFASSSKNWPRPDGKDLAQS